MNRLHRSRRNKVLLGVCGGLAEYLNIDPTLVRIVTILIFLSGVGFFMYFIAALLMPVDKEYPGNDQWGSSYGSGSGSYTNTSTGSGSYTNTGSESYSGPDSSTGSGPSTGAGFDSGFDSDSSNTGDWDRPAKYNNEKNKIVLGTILVGFGILFLVKQVLPGLFDLRYMIPLLLICIGGFIVFKGRK